MRKLFCVLAGLLFSLGSISADTLEGKWSGVLEVPPQVSLKLVFNISAASDGGFTVTMDSPEQNAYGIAAEVNYLSEDSISVSVPAIAVVYKAALASDGTLSGTFSQGMLRRDLVLKRGADARKRPQTPVPPFEYSIEDVAFRNEAADVTLAGTLVRPARFSAETPVVILVSGSGLQNRDEEIFEHRPFAVIADWLARNGIASLRYDDRGFGDSTGSGAVATTADFASDAACGVEYLRSKAEFGKIGVLGHSEGGEIAFILASDDKSAPDFIVTLGAPALRGDSILADQSRTAMLGGGMPEDAVNSYVSALLKLYPAYTSGGADAARRVIAQECKGWDKSPLMASLKANMEKIVVQMNPWIAYTVAFSPSESISGIKCPAFVLYGEKDTQVRAQLNAPVVRKLNSSVKVKEYSGLNHLFQNAATGAVSEYAVIEETISPSVLSDIVEFINSL